MLQAFTPYPTIWKMTYRFTATLTLLVTVLLTGSLLAVPAHHLPATSATAPEIPVPENLRAPFGWHTIAIPPAGGSGETILKWPDTTLPAAASPALRLTVGLECREKTRLSLSLPGSAEPLGELDVSYASVLLIVELPLTRPDAEKVISQGLRITRTEGTAPFFLFSPTSQKTPVILRPHILAASDTDRWDEFMKRMAGLETIQPFGWMEGCTLVGTQDLAEAFPQKGYDTALENRLDLFLTAKDLNYEDTRSRPIKNRFHTIEGTLPVAAITQTRPDHPSVDIALDFWNRHRAKGPFGKGLVMDATTCSAEGSYTIAFPMMRIANQRGDKQLAEEALEQIRLRVKLLKDPDGNIYLRNVNGNWKMKNWARGITWYYLGLIRTIAEAPEGMDTADLRAEAETVMDFVISHQLPDGLWRNFFDDPDQKIDTSGSAGIAAALALGAKHGILPEKAETAARKTLAGLEQHLTPDGLLTMGTPSNRGNAAMGNRRTIFPVGMGLAAQLIAALEVRE